MWDLLLSQAVLTLNLLRQATLNPSVSAWELLEGPLDYNANPLAPLGCPVMIHKETATRNSWDFRSKEGWSIGTALDHYRCEQVIPWDTKSVTLSDTVNFLHQYTTAPKVTPVNHILHSINTLTGDIKETPITVYNDQLKAITALRDACHWWESPGTPENLPDPIAPRKIFHLRLSPRVDSPIVNPAPPPGVTHEAKRPIIHELVAKRTRSNTAPI